MNTGEAVKIINSQIVEWSRISDKLVVAIDGYTGVGKTTVANVLEEVNPDILVIHFDDFILPPQKFKEILETCTDKSVAFELHRNDYAKIENLIALFKNNNQSLQLLISNPITGAIDTPKTFDLPKKIIVIEGVFLFHPLLLNHLWDKRIYLDGDIEKIDDRRVAREKERWGEKYFPETHPNSFFGQVTIALKRYRIKYHPEKLADLVLYID